MGSSRVLARYCTRYMFRGQTFLCQNVLAEIYTKNSNSKNASKLLFSIISHMQFLNYKKCVDHVITDSPWYHSEWCFKYSKQRHHTRRQVVAYQTVMGKKQWAQKVVPLTCEKWSFTRGSIKFLSFKRKILEFRTEGSLWKLYWKLCRSTQLRRRKSTGRDSRCCA